MAAPSFKQITGSVLAANIEDLSGHQLFADLYEVRLNDDGQKVFNQISENVYQMRDLNAPFSLYYDQQVLVSDGVSHDLNFMLQAPRATSLPAATCATSISTHWKPACRSSCATPGFDRFTARSPLAMNFR